MSKKVLELLKQKFGDAILETHSQFGDDTAVVDPASWLAIAQHLRDDPRLAMNQFIDLCGVDYLGVMETRFEVVMHLRSFTHNHRLRLKARVGDDEGSGAEIDSVRRRCRFGGWLRCRTPRWLSGCAPGSRSPCRPCRSAC